MSISATIDRLHLQVKQNKWYGYFATFCRMALAAGFLPSGFVKIIGERFTDLHNNHPLGHYLEALHLTGYYYTFIGIVQVLAALFLLISRTAALGAFIYFPVILNICILSLSVGFEGSLLSSPLMVLANLYLLCWYYDKWKFILPFNSSPLIARDPKAKFPILFFIGVATTIVITGFAVTNAYSIFPRNTLQDCATQCDNGNDPKACEDFCNCIHIEGKPYYKCKEEYNDRIRQKNTR